MKRIIVILVSIGLFMISAVAVLADGVFPAWHQGFEQDTAGWITDDTPGPAGWCGDITRYERGSGPVVPSVGHGYAVVENGPCNQFYRENTIWQESGPAVPFGGYSQSWPQSGFVTELDIYLDPGWQDGTSFDYYVSFRLLDRPFVEGLRYLLFPVVKESGTLMVAGNAVSKAGWYTFRLKFREVNGHLAVAFELADRGQVLFAQPVTTTAFHGSDLSSIAVSNVGTGYFWFDSISPGLQLPIDHAMYRPGK